ncbi:MAG: sarcosine oxidase subunit alpha family protein [Betaproteobacteria bacterium]|nr:sarcosine oxidase subunit alpha family protein [Betaproteobacteria bacterium]
MSEQTGRLDRGGRIDRSRPMSFVFDGRAYRGFFGDTLASALLANGVHLVGRSFKYHRPRGIYAAGVEEPNALVGLRQGGRHEPNVVATTVELFDGLEASSQHRWPSLDFDVMSVIDRFSRVFASGFYYKTFMGPFRGAWMFYEKFIRRAAGFGDPPLEPDPDRYEKGHAFCDVLVIGGGPSGLAAALAAGRSGARVVLVEDGAELGGALLSRPQGGDTDAWLASAVGELKGLPNVRLMTRTTVFGAYDNLVFGLLERVGDHLPVPAPDQPRQRYWILRARQAVLATGMLERPIVFGNNDLPGVMLASAGRSYVNRYAVIPGRSVVVFTNNDTAYGAALDLKAAGADVAVVDVRGAIGAELDRAVREAGIALHAGCAVARANGRKRVRNVEVCVFDAVRGRIGATKSRLPCDLLLVSGGWTPTLQLLGQRGAPLAYDDKRAMLIAGAVPAGYRVAGSAAGEPGVRQRVASGMRQGGAAAEACGYAPSPEPGVLPVRLPDEPAMTGIAPVAVIPDPPGAGYRKKFVDFQHDVGYDDIALALSEGYESIEHLKRYTTLGMAPDQGKTSSFNALAIAAQMLGRPIAAVGTTTFRPPYRPVSIGALAGAETGLHFKPTRRSPMHDLHARNGAVFITTGLWLRPWYYPMPGESIREAYVREADAVRKSVGMVDVSSLGKIDVQGPDAAEFLNRVYTNAFDTLPVGRARYGVMLRPDGIVIDDGTTSRLAEHHYFMTTTTAGAGAVMTFLEYLLQTAWPDLKVQVTSVTSQWAAIAVAGPRSRDLIASLVRDVDMENAAFPFMGVRQGHLGAIPVRLLRISFSGEMAYEIYAPAGCGETLWRAISDAGPAFDLVPYGIEALGALRIEKGHVAGAEIDGRTTLADMGLARMASKKKPFIGSALMQREGLLDAHRPQLVGLESASGDMALRAGAILCEPGRHQGHGIGFVSSVTYSPALGRHVALGFVSRGLSREGDVIDAVFPLRGEVTPVRVRSAHFVDPEGRRLNA